MSIAFALSLALAQALALAGVVHAEYSDAVARDAVRKCCAEAKNISPYRAERIGAYIRPLGSVPKLPSPPSTTGPVLRRGVLPPRQSGDVVDAPRVR